MQTHAFNTTCFAALKKASINIFLLLGILESDHFFFLNPDRLKMLKMLMILTDNIFQTPNSQKA